MNNKGFTMIEMLGVVVILGIIMTVGYASVSIYKNKAIQQSYDTMAGSASSAIANYLLDFPSDSGAVYIKDLYEEKYLERPADPKDENKNCDGVVIYKKTKGSGNNLSNYDYTVHLCCSQYQKTYTYPDGEVKDIVSSNYCPNLEYVDMTTGELLKAPTCTIQLSGSKGTGNYFKGTVTVRLKVNGTATEKGLSTSRGVVNNKNVLTHSANGENITYYGYVSNAMGENTCSVKFTKETTPPTVAVSEQRAETGNLVLTFHDDSSLWRYAITKSTSVPDSDSDVWRTISGTSARVERTVSAGDYYIYVKDKAGNTSRKTVQVDGGSRPSCSLKLTGSKSATGDYVGPVTVTMTTTGSVRTKGLAREQRSTNGRSRVEVSGNGKFTYYGYVENNLGYGTCSKTFTIDSTGPSVTITNESNENWTKAPVVIRIKSNDSSGIKSVKWRETGDWRDDDWTSVSEDLTEVAGTWRAERDSIVYIRVEDKNGNVTTEETRVRIDKTPPKYILKEVTCGQHPDHSNLKRFLYFTFSDVGSGLGERTISWQWYDSSGNTVGSPQSSVENYNGKDSDDDRLWDNSPYLTYEHKVCDVVGNCITSSEVKKNMTVKTCS